MRDRNHYIAMFENAGTVGVELLARALHTVRTGVDERPPADLVRALKKRHGDQVWGEQALMLLADEGREPTKHPGVGLVAVRNAAGMTQADLAALSGVSRRAIQLIEKGERDPGTQTLGRLMRVLLDESTELTRLANTYACDGPWAFKAPLVLFNGEMEFPTYSYDSTRDSPFQVAAWRSLVGHEHEHWSMFWMGGLPEGVRGSYAQGKEIEAVVREFFEDFNENAALRRWAHSRHH